MNVPLHDNARTLVLTGASRGIGHATVKKFSAGGWRVITVSRQPFSALCPWPGGDKNHVQIDLADPADVGRARRAAPLAQGPVAGRACSRERVYRHSLTEGVPT